MSTTYINAVDEIFSLFKVAFSAGATAIVGYVPEIRWQGVEEPAKPDLSKYWVRVSQQTVNEAQSTLHNGECRRYATDGFVIVQIFCPRSDAGAMTKGRKLAILSRDSFRGKTTPGGIWFRNVRIKELNPEVNWQGLNVIADYKYDEIG